MFIDCVAGDIVMLTPLTGSVHEEEVVEFAWVVVDVVVVHVIAVLAAGP